jgi:acyl-coenzyme A thioesterase PaaI-like protein
MEVDVDIADCAGGYATWTSIPEDCEVLAVEHEISLVVPVVGGRLEALVTVLRWGRSLSVHQPARRTPTGAAR